MVFNQWTKYTIVYLLVKNKLKNMLLFVSCSVLVLFVVIDTQNWIIILVLHCYLIIILMGGLRDRIGWDYNSLLGT
jgi:hypothetical protein